MDAADNDDDDDDDHTGFLQRDFKEIMATEMLRTLMTMM